MHSTYNYFIDLDDETIIKQKCKCKCKCKCKRLLNIFANDYNMNMLVSNNKQYIKNLSIGIDKFLIN
jgi:hypothetical protein